MRNKGTQEKIMTSGSTLPVVILIGIVAWLGHSLFYPAMAPISDHFVLDNRWDYSHLAPWLGYILNIAIYLLAGYLLLELNNRSDILRVRNSVLAAIFYLFISFCPELYSFSLTNLSLLALLYSLFFLFQSYQCRYSSGYLFHSFAILGIGSLFFPQLMYLTPIWFIGSMMLQSFNIRSFFGAIIGFSLPYWASLSYALYRGDIDIFLSPFNEITRFGGMNIFEEVSLPNILSIGYFLLLFIISMLYCLAIDYNNKIRTRIILHFIIILNIALFAFMIIQPLYEVQLLTLSLPGVSIMVCHFFIRNNSRTSYYIFIGALVLMFITYIARMLPIF